MTFKACCECKLSQLLVRSTYLMAGVKSDHKCSTMAMADQTEAKMAASLAVKGQGGLVLL